MTVRRVGADELGALAELRVRWTTELRGEVDDPGFVDRLTAWWDRETGRRVAWIAEADGIAVGMLNLAEFERMPRPGVPTTRWGYVANVYVVPECRDGGVGTELLAAATAYADESGLVRLVLSPTPRSVPYYERAGFSAENDLMVRGHADVQRVP